MTTTIYQLSDPTSGEVRYIGKTVKRVEHRLCAHVCDSRRIVSSHLYKWMRSLSKIPDITPIAVCGNDSAFEVEREIIADFRKRGYRLVNGTDGGDGAPGHKCSEETKAKLRELNTGRKMPPRSDQWRQRMSAAKRGSKLSVGHRRKIGASLVGRPVSETTRAKQSAAMTGRVFSEIHRAKISAAKMGQLCSEETRAKMRLAQTPESRLRHSEIMTGRTKSPESVERGSAKLRGRKLSPERIEQIRMATANYWARKHSYFPIPVRIQL